jgi:O-antigen/teichoic acid export membrane protein
MEHEALSFEAPPTRSILIRSVRKLLSDEGLTKKATLNAVATTLDYAARWIVSFVINPLLVAGLGDYRYGVWQVLGRLIGYLSPAGGRPEQALKWTIATQQASTDYGEKRRQVGSAIAIWVLFLPPLSLLGGVLTWFVPVWLKAPQAVSPAIRWAAALLVADLIMTALVEVPRAVLRGENLGYKRMGLSTLLVFVGGALTALAISVDGGLIGVAAANLLTTLLTGALFVRVARSYVVWFGVAKPIAGAVRGFLRLSFWFMAWTLVMQALKGSDLVILGVLDSAEQVTRYTLTRYMPETLMGLVAILMFGITPGLGRIVGSKDFGKAARVRAEIMLLTWIVVASFGSTMLLWNRSFVQLWVGSRYYAGTIPNFLMILAVAQFVFIRNDANIIDLSLDLRAKVLTGLLSAALSAAIAAAFMARLRLGIVGLILGYIAGQSLLSIVYPMLVGRFLGLSTYAQVKGVVRPASVTALVAVSLAGLGHYVTVHTWPALVLSGAMTLPLVFAVIVYAGATAPQRAAVVKRLRRVLPSGAERSEPSEPGGLP